MFHVFSLEDSEETSVKDLERFVKGFGRVREVLLKPGYGFIEFEDPRDADDAIYELNGKTLNGDRVNVEPARGNSRRGGGGGGGRGGFGSRGGGGGYRGSFSRSNDRGSSSSYPPIRTRHRVIVENLATEVSWQELKDYVRGVAEVTFAIAHRDRRNEGVLEFQSASDMERAIEKLDDTTLGGRRIKMRPERSSGGGSRRSPSRSRSRSSSRSRSRSKSGGRRSPSRSKSPAPNARKRNDRSESNSPPRNKKSVSRTPPSD